MTFKMPTVEESVARMKREIIEDVRSGRVPADCPSFSALHDHVDANSYGGFCEDHIFFAMQDQLGPEKLVDFLNEAQGQIDVWLKEGGVAQDMASNSPIPNQS